MLKGLLQENRADELEMSKRGYGDIEPTHAKHNTKSKNCSLSGPTIRYKLSQVEKEKAEIEARYWKEQATNQPPRWETQTTDFGFISQLQRLYTINEWHTFC